jgi:hypothetical protein
MLTATIAMQLFSACLECSVVLCSVVLYAVGEAWAHPAAALLQAWQASFTLAAVRRTHCSLLSCVVTALLPQRAMPTTQFCTTTAWRAPLRRTALCRTAAAPAETELAVHAPKFKKRQDKNEI